MVFFIIRASKLKALALIKARSLFTYKCGGCFFVKIVDIDLSFDNLFPLIDNIKIEFSLIYFLKI